MRPAEQWILAAVIFTCALALLAWYLRSPDDECVTTATDVLEAAPSCFKLLPYVPDGDVDAPSTRFLPPLQVQERANAAWRTLPEYIQLKLDARGVRMTLMESFGPDPAVRACYIPMTRSILLYYPHLCSTTDQDIANVVWHEAAHAAGLDHSVIGKYGI